MARYVESDAPDALLLLSKTMPKRIGAKWITKLSANFKMDRASGATGSTTNTKLKRFLRTFRNMPGNVGRNKSIKLDGHRRYCESFSKSLIHVIAESRTSIANSEFFTAKSNASSSDATDPSISASYNEKLNCQYAACNSNIKALTQIVQSFQNSQFATQSLQQRIHIQWFSIEIYTIDE